MDKGILQASEFVSNLSNGSKRKRTEGDLDDDDNLELRADFDFYAFKARKFDDVYFKMVQPSPFLSCLHSPTTTCSLGRRLPSRSFPSNIGHLLQLEVDPKEMVEEIVDEILEDVQQEMVEAEESEMVGSEEVEDDLQKMVEKILDKILEGIDEAKKEVEDSMDNMEADHADLGEDLTSDDIEEQNLEDELEQKLLELEEGEDEFSTTAELNLGLLDEEDNGVVQKTELEEGRTREILVFN